MDHIDFSSSDDDMFTTMMYDHYMKKLEDDVSLQIRTVNLNGNHATGHKCLYLAYFVDNYVYDSND